MMGFEDRSDPSIDLTSSGESLQRMGNICPSMNSWLMKLLEAPKSSSASKWKRETELGSVLDRDCQDSGK